MNKIKKLTEDAHSNVGPGWWPIIDKYLPQIVELVPESMINIKEKYGSLRIQVYGKCSNKEKLQELKLAAETESIRVCEQCGKPGRLRNKGSYIQTLCFRCYLKNKLSIK